MKLHSNNYTVAMDLQSGELKLSQDQLFVFSKRLEEIGTFDPDFLKICSCRNGILRYESETLLPVKMDGKKPKVLLVLGNPAIHSVTSGMFFYSKANGDRHGFWGKLAKAGLIHTVPKTTREEEANDRRNTILNGFSSENYLVGLTTFYSFPTPGPDNAPFSGVAGVENLFQPALEQLCRMETKRILSYPFTNGAIVVFTQQSSFEHFSRLSGIKPVSWPIRGKDSGGIELARQLSQHRYN